MQTKKLYVFYGSQPIDVITVCCMGMNQKMRHHIRLPFKIAHSNTLPWRFPRDISFFEIETKTEQDLIAI